MSINPKVTEVVKRMLDEIQEISEYYESGSEIFFRFKGHTFSITRNSEGIFYFFVYPRWTASLEALSREFEAGNADDIKYVTFNSDEDKLLKPHVIKIYEFLTVKAGGIEDIFDDILNEPLF